MAYQPIPQKDEDTASASGDKLVPIAAVRNDAAASKTDSDGDYSAIAVDAAGRVGIADLGGSISVDDNGTSLTVDGTVAVSGVGGTVTVSGTVTANQGSPPWQVQSNSVNLATEATLGNVDSSLNLIEQIVHTDGDAISKIAVVGSYHDSDNLVHVLHSSASGLLVDGSGVTQPISGTVTANQGGAPWQVQSNSANLATQTTAALIASNQTDKSQFTKLTDGTDTALVTGSGELNVLATAQPGVDIGDVTINNASGASAVNIQDGGNTITVDGTVNAAQSGAWSVTANAGTNLNTSLLALDSTLTDGTQRSIITDGTDDATVRDVTGAKALDVAIVDGSGNQITTFGGGTQYAEGDTADPITGTAAMWEDSGDTLRAISMGKPLPVQPGTSVAFPVTDNAGSLTVDGTVTANQGGAPWQVQSNAANIATQTTLASVLSTQTDKTQFTKITDGTDTALVTAGGDLNVVFSNSTIAVTNAGTFAVQADTELPAAAALADNTANPTVPGVGAFLMSYDGSTWDRTKGDSTDGLLVNLGSNNDVTVTGSVTANAGTNLNTSALALESGGNLATIAGAVRAEDSASATTHTGIGALVVQSATPADTAADLDYSFLQMSGGRLWVDASGKTLTVGSHAVTNAGTFAVQVDGAALTSLQLIDDVVYTDDTSTHSTGTSKGALFMAVANPADSAVDANDIGAVAMTTSRALKCDLTTLAATATAVGNGSSNNGVLRVAQVSDGTGQFAAITTSIVPGTAATHLGKAEDAQHSSGDTGVAVWTVRDNASSGQPATTFGANSDYAPFVVDDNYRLYTQATGNVAHDGPDAGHPLKIGHKAIAHGTNPTAVAANDRTDWYANRAGVPWVIGGHPNIQTVEYYTTGSQTNDDIISVSTGSKIVITAIEVTVSAACTVNVKCRIGFGTSAVPTEPTTGNTVAGMVVSHGKISPGSGIVIGNGSGIIAVGADDQDLRITCDAPTSGDVHVRASYYTIES